MKQFTKKKESSYAVIRTDLHVSLLLLQSLF